MFVRQQRSLSEMVTAPSAAGFGPVLEALITMQSNAERGQKTQAHEYLEKFQKSVGQIILKISMGADLL